MSAKWFLSILSAVAMTLGVTPLHAGEKALTLLTLLALATLAGRRAIEWRLPAGGVQRQPRQMLEEGG